jgi:hypothetical protein
VIIAIFKHFLPDMRILSVTALIFLLLVQPLSMSWIYVSFKLNQVNIAKTLCVQKDVKGNKCQGCCQLKKQLKKSDQAEQRELPKSHRIKGESPFCSRHLQTRNNSLAPGEKEEAYFIRNTWIENPSVIVEIFHPPKFTAYKA